MNAAEGAGGDVPDDSPDSPMFELGGPLSRLSAALRIQGDELDPDHVSGLMGVSPKFAARKGERRQSGSRTIVQRVGIWTFDLSSEPSSEWELDDLVVALLSRLPEEQAVWDSLAAAFEMDVFCGLFMGLENQGADLRPSTLEALARRHLTLGLDIYGPAPGDDDL